MRRAVAAAAVAWLGAGCALYLGPDGPPGDVVCDGQPQGCTIAWDSDTQPCCDSTVWACNPDTGEWELQYYCDPPPAVHVTGTIELHQVIVAASPSCPAVVPADPLTLHVVDGYPQAVTADAPAQVEWSELTEEAGSPTNVFVQLADTWGAVPVDVLYELQADAANQVTGTAGTALGSTCTVTLDVTGTWGR